MKKLLCLVISLGMIYAGGDGSLNNAFGTNGTAITAFSIATGLIVTAQFVQADGAIIVSGQFQKTNLLPSGTVMRYTPQGMLDTTFNQAGTIPGIYQLESAFFFDVFVQPDKKIVAAGVINVAYFPFGIGSLVVVRLNSDGTFDSTFNNGNPLILESMLISAFDLFPWTGATSLADGKIVVTSNLADEHDHIESIVVIRLTEGGQLDSSFGVDGVVIVQPLVNGDPSKPVRYAVGRAIALQSDQKIVVSGSTDFEENNDSVLLMRLLPNGQLDPSFTDGSAQPGVILDAGKTDVDIQQSLIIQPDGNILVGSTTVDNAGKTSIVIIRKTSTGAPDTSFNTTGTTHPLLTLDGEGYLSSMCLQNDGKIVASIVLSALPFEGAPPIPLQVVRYTATGELDTATFGTPNGYVTESFGTDYAQLAAPMSLLQDGTIVVSSSLYKSAQPSVGIVEFLVANPLAPTTITGPSTALFGTAQPLSIVTTFVDGNQVCSQGPVNNVWGCSVSLSPGVHTAYAVAYYPGGNVNLESSTISLALSSLTTGIINKYCPVV